MKSSAKTTDTFDLEFIITMINEQLETWAELALKGQRVKVLLFDCYWTQRAIHIFRQEGWMVEFDHKPAAPPDRIYYYFSYSHFKILA
jgi:hypothetical protein